MNWISVIYASAACCTTTLAGMSLLEVEVSKYTSARKNIWKYQAYAVGLGLATVVLCTAAGVR